MTDLVSWAPYLEYPNVVHIETLTECNAACSFCVYPDLERKGKKMPDTLIDKILTDLEAIPLPFYISPFKVNEPFLDVRLMDILEDINRRLPRAIIRLFSNGTPITVPKLARLAELKRVQHLWISLNDHRAKEYEETMQLPLDRTLARLDVIHETSLPFPVKVSRVVDNTVADDEFMWWMQERYPRFEPKLVQRCDWLGDRPGQAVPDEVPTEPCVRWWEIDITSTGVVSLCCMDGKAKYAIGDVTTQSVLEVYNTPTFKRMRQDGQSRHTYEPCRRCTY